MKKQFLRHTLVWVIAALSYISCALGVNKIDTNYIVTINGIELYHSAAIPLLRNIIKEEQETANIVDKNTGKNLGITLDILKPEINISIDKSKTVELAAWVFEILKEHVQKSPDEFIYNKPLDDGRIVETLKIGDRFIFIGIYNKHDKNVKEYGLNGLKITMAINNKNQIEIMEVYRNNYESEISKAIPIHE